MPRRADGAGADGVWGAVDAALRRARRRLADSEAGGADQISPSARDGGWLAEQTLASSVPRRALYGALGLRAGDRLLDVGTGLGPVAVETAAAYGCRAVGLDVAPAMLGQARQVVADLEAGGWLEAAGGADGAATAGSVALTSGEVTALPFAASTFDVVTARFVLQHLPRPHLAVAEMARVLVPSGLVCLVDADDGLSFSYPEPPEPVRRLIHAYQQAQQERGGDRTIGRKLAGLLDQAGVEVQAVLVLPQAAYGPIEPDGVGQRLLARRLRAFAPELVDRRLLTEAEVRAGLDLLETQSQGPTTVFDGHVAVLGRRP